MESITKLLQIITYESGITRVVCSDKKLMAKWYAMDYLKDKARLTENGSYVAEVSEEYYFSSGFRKHK